MAGAGESYILELTLNEQKSVVATTSYDLPYIASISGPGAINAQGDGNESVYIHGYNFGPIDQPTFFESMTYGENGDEYKAKCEHLGHILVHCLTVPGSGANLLWQITVLKIVA